MCCDKGREGSVFSRTLGGQEVSWHWWALWWVLQGWGGKYQRRVKALGGKNLASKRQKQTIASEIDELGIWTLVEGLWGTKMPLKGFQGEIVSYLVYKIYYFFKRKVFILHLCLELTMSTRLASTTHLPLSPKYWD